MTPAVYAFTVPGNPVGKARAAVMTLAYHELMTRDVGPLFESEMEGARA